MSKGMPQVGDYITSDLYGDENPWKIDEVNEHSWSIHRVKGNQQKETIAFERFNNGSWRHAIIPEDLPMTQIGGDHYEKMDIQPWEVIRRGNLDFWEGNVVKYVMRYRTKNGLEDLKKAKHYLDYLINREGPA